MVNREKIIEGIKLILEGIGEDIHREGLKDTPLRVARMYEDELFSGLYEDASVHMQTRFHVEDNQMIMEKDTAWLTESQTTDSHPCIFQYRKEI